MQDVCCCQCWYDYYYWQSIKIDPTRGSGTNAHKHSMCATTLPTGTHSNCILHHTCDVVCT